MWEKFLCFIHSSYLCSRRQKMQSIMKKNIYFIIAFCTFLTTEASAQQQVSFGPLHSPDSPREEWLLPGDTVYQAGKPMIYQGKPVKNAYLAPAQLSDKKETLGKNGKVRITPFLLNSCRRATASMVVFLTLTTATPCSERCSKVWM